MTDIGIDQAMGKFSPLQADDARGSIIIHFQDTEDLNLWYCYPILMSMTLKYDS